MGFSVVRRGLILRVFGFSRPSVATHMIPPLLLLAVLCLFFAGPASAQNPFAEAGRHTRDAFAAYDRGDFAGFRDHLAAALRLRPNHPGLTYNLAAAHARNGERDEAVALLERYAGMGLVAQAGTDDDFESVRGDSGFASVLERLDANRQPVGTSTEAFRLADPRMIPEGIAYDPVTETFFVSSVRQRRIVRFDRADGERAFAPAGEETLWSVLGLAVDAERRTLWAASAALPVTAGATEADRGSTGLFAYDLDTGALRARYLLPGTDGRASLGDLTVAPGGDVYATDGTGGMLYVLRHGADTLQPAVEPGVLVSPQGVCPSGDGRLYLADYALGLFVVDPAARTLTPLPPPEGQTLLGIDGLACAGEHLLAVQNGVRPERVLRIDLDGDAVRSVAVLEANNPRFDQPTLGVVVGDRFFYVGNSHWSRVDAQGVLDEQGLEAPVVWVLEL